MTCKLGDALSDTSIDSVVSGRWKPGLSRRSWLSLWGQAAGPALVDLLTSAVGDNDSQFLFMYCHHLRYRQRSDSLQPSGTTAKKKYSLAGPDIFPTLAIVDPGCLHCRWKPQSLRGWMPSIKLRVHLESPRQQSLCNCTRALKVGIPALIQLSDSLDSPEARRDLAEASLLAGLAISHTRTALCHSMSYPITAHFGVAHGLACAFTMVSVLQQCITVDDGRLARLAVDLFGPAASTHQLIGLYIEITDRLEVRKRVACRIDSLDALQMLVPEMITPGRADNCMVAVDPSLLTEF